MIARLAREESELIGREILAPLLAGGRIRTRLSGLVYEFRPTTAFVGWGIFRPRNPREADLLGEAAPWQRAAYLELFPLLRVVLLWPDPGRPASWWALPFNESDARQRFGLSRGEPLLVHLGTPETGAERFERAIARVDGVNLWYDGPDPRADPTHAEWLRDAAARDELPERLLPGLAKSERLALVYARIRALDGVSLDEQRRAFGPEHRWQEAERREWLRRLITSGKLEGELRRALARADATLVSVGEVPGRDGEPGYLVVEWTAHGDHRRYRSAIDPDRTVIASGICLSGRDRDFDLTSMVSVMEGAG